LALARQLSELAAHCFRESPPERMPYPSSRMRSEPSRFERSLPLLLEAFVAISCDVALAEVVGFVLETPHQFSMDDCQVPTLKSLLPWSKRRLGFVHPQLVAWLDCVREKLELATAKAPAPPADWTRPANLDCWCRHCAEFMAFMANAEMEVGRFRARELERDHLVGVLGRNPCDVEYELDRTRSPYTLVFTKTNGAFDRAVQRFEADRKLLNALPSMD
jgi:hypothetical protein